MQEVDYVVALVHNLGVAASLEAGEPALSERGERGDAARTRHPHGQGLGLSIAHRVAEGHGFAVALRPGAEGGLEVELRGGSCGEATQLLLRQPLSVEHRTRGAEPQNTSALSQCARDGEIDVVLSGPRLIVDVIYKVLAVR